MHNVNTDAVAATAAAAAASPEAVLQPVVLSGEWQVSDSEPQFTAMIPYPRIMMKEAKAWPNTVCGAISP